MRLSACVRPWREFGENSFRHRHYPVRRILMRSLENAGRKCQPSRSAADDGGSRVTYFLCFPYWSLVLVFL